MASKIPPSIANAAPDELRVLLVKTLTKLRASDVKLEAQSKQHAEEVNNLQIKLKSLEGTLEERIAAETDGLTQSLGESNGRIRALQRQLEEQQGAAASLQQSLTQREAVIAGLENTLQLDRQNHKQETAQLEEKFAATEAQSSKLKEQLEQTKAAAQEQQPSAEKEQAQSDDGPSTPTATSNQAQTSAEQAKIIELEAKLQAAEQQAACIEEEYTAKLSTATTELSSTQQQLTATIEKLSAASQELSSTTDKLTDLEKEKKAANAAVATVHALVQKFTDVLSKPASEVTEALDNFEAPGDAITELLNATGETQGVQGVYREVAVDMVAVQKRVVSVLKDVQVQGSQSEEGLKKTMEGLDNKIKDLMSTVDDLRSKLKDSEVARTAAEKQLKSTTEANTSTTETTAQGLEAAKAEVQQIRKETDLERARVKKAMIELKKRVDGLQREKQRAEQAAMEESTKLSAEADALRAASNEATLRAQAAEQRAEQLEAELRDYKVRAHSLLKAKETQIKQAKDAALQEMSAVLAEAQTHAAQAEEAKRIATGELDQIRSTLQSELGGLQAKHAEATADLAKEAATAKEAAEAAKRQYEHLQLRYDSLETRTQQLQSQISEAQEAAAAAEEARKEADAVVADYAKQKQTAVESAQTRASEIAQLADANSTLRAELAGLKKQLEQQQASAAALQGFAPSTITGSEGPSRQSTTAQPFDMEQPNSTYSFANGSSNDPESSLLVLAERDKQLAHTRQRINELEREVAELERECQLHHTQETALKEAVRELEREMLRMKLPDQHIDMEYFKNVMLKLFETGQEESLLPVVATVLKFSPAELNRCRVAMLERQRLMKEVQEEQAEGGVSNYLGSWIGLTG